MLQPSGANAKSLDFVLKRLQYQKKVDPVFKNEHFAISDLDVLVWGISSKLVHCAAKDLDRVVEASIKEMLDFLRIDYAALFQEEETDSNRFFLTHANVRTGYSNEAKPLLTKDSCEFDPEQYGLSLPLFDGDKIYGILALGNAKEMLWPEDLVHRLRVMAHVLSSVLLQRKTGQKLHESLLELEKLKKQMQRENAYLRDEMKVPCSTEITYQSSVMRAAVSKAEQVAATNATVLFYGETGTGKEVFASLIHKMSPRGFKPMIRVNCGAIPAALVESEMFGREKGAYTGALSRQIGRFELAHTSTIFLDEITALPMEAQVKLLRVLQEREIERLGNPKPINIDVRVIAATNQCLEKAVQEGKFRQDLYYRLNVFPIDIPPLRERREDIPMLVWSFIDELSSELGKKVETVSRKSMETLKDYAWPGNVRELRNAIERAMIVSNSPNLEIEIPKGITSNGVSAALTLKDMEIQYIRRVLENTAWKIRGKQGAADILGMKPTTLETRMAKLGIRRPENTNLR